VYSNCSPTIGVIFLLNTVIGCMYNLGAITAIPPTNMEFLVLKAPVFFLT
jgi:hypothetical protein